MEEFLRKAQPRTIALLLISLVLMLTTIQILYLVLPQFKHYRQLANSYQVLERASASSDGLEQQLASATEAVNKLSYKLHGDMSGLPDKQMESFIIGRLQKVSWKTDVELASVIPGRGNRVQMFQEILFDVQINATYFNFFNWLQAINDELGYIVVEKFEIHSKGGQVENDPQLNITLTLVSYRMLRDA